MVFDAIKRFGHCLNRFSQPVLVLTAVAAVMVAIFTLSYTKDTLERSQRAWLAPGGIKIQTPFRPNTYHEVWLNYGNTGKEPGTKIKAVIQAIVLRRDKIRDAGAVNAAVSKAMGGIECKDVEPDPDGFVAYPSDPGAYGFRIGVQADQVDQIINKQNYLLIAGCFAYATFSVDGHASFCRFFDFNTGETSMEWPSSICFIPEYAD